QGDHHERDERHAAANHAQRLSREARTVRATVEPRHAGVLDRYPAPRSGIYRAAGARIRAIALYGRNLGTDRRPEALRATKRSRHASWQRAARRWIPLQGPRPDPAHRQGQLQALWRAAWGGSCRPARTRRDP